MTRFELSTNLTEYEIISYLLYGKLFEHSLVATLSISRYKSGFNLLELICVDKRPVFDIFLQRTSSKTKMTEKYVLGSGTRFPAWLSSGPI